MIIRVKARVKRVIQTRQLERFLLLCGIIVLLLELLNTTRADAGDPKPNGAVGFYVKDGEATWIFPGGVVQTTELGLTISEFEKLHPLAAKAESAIVHIVPACPVIIDGIVYPARGISLFNGKRLRFVTDIDDNLCAFTTAQRFEQFQRQQFAQILHLEADMYGYFYQGSNYTGGYVSLMPGTGITALSPYAMDNDISSTGIYTATQWAYLFDYDNYGGDWYAMPPASAYPNLSNQGWNDRASSVWINQN
jgi:hypothetical protein